MSNKLYNFINLHDGEERKDVVLENVTSNISFRGSNLWILACAIIIASIGLNVNSTAVIIGAMLISPLMGPIVGAGFALGTYNFPLLRKSIKNLVIATIVSLGVSGIYFYVSPFKDVQSELLSRTSPNIYDVLIAFFGGLVGVIAITRVEKGNPIPGVAIATALMPPLCTAGYGLATLNLSFFLGAFYLYCINCVFICIATFLIIKYLKYPANAYIDPVRAKKIRFIITGLILIMIIPSFYLAFNLFEEKKFTKTVDKFINAEFNDQGYTVIYKRINYNAHPKKIELAILNKSISQEDNLKYNEKLTELGLENTELTFRQDDGDLKTEILNELTAQNMEMSERDLTINALRQELNKYKFNQYEVVEEMSVLFPNIRKISFGTVEFNRNTDSASVQLIVLFEPSKNGEGVDEQKVIDWLKVRLQWKDIILLSQ